MTDDNKDEFPEGSRFGKIARNALQVAGSVPAVGGIFSAVAGAWSEKGGRGKGTVPQKGQGKER
jgi:hypothetical protein